MIALSQTRAWQIDALLASSRTSTPFASDFGQVFASIPVQLEGHQVVPLQSKVYRNWLLARFQTEHGVVPRPSAIRDVVESLQAQVEFPAEPASSAARPAVARRIASSPGKILLDLHNDQGEAIEISAEGWHLTQNLAGYFRAAGSARPLPHPQPASPQAFDQLRGLLGLSPEHFTPCLSWLIAAMSPTGPYPILVLQGASSSAKSVVAGMLRALIDPGPAPFCPLPCSARDLQSLASHHWIVALDNVDLLPSATLRKLIRLSTGIVFPLRDSPSDPEPFHLHLARPLILTTETALPRNDRVVTIEFPPHAAPVSQAAFEQLRPQFLGALCTAASAILAGSAPPAWQSYTASPDPIAIAVRTFMETQTAWTGTATELLLRLRETNPILNWPETPKGISQLLGRTALDNIDFQSRQTPHGTRSVTLTKIEKASKTSADALPSSAALPLRDAPPSRANPDPIATPKQKRARKQVAPQSAPQPHAILKTAGQKRQHTGAAPPANSRGRP